MPFVKIFGKSFCPIFAGMDLPHLWTQLSSHQAASRLRYDNGRGPPARQGPRSGDPLSRVRAGCSRRRSLCVFTHQGAGGVPRPTADFCGSSPDEARARRLSRPAPTRREFAFPHRFSLHATLVRTPFCPDFSRPARRRIQELDSGGLPGRPGPHHA
jgi:hypothetical protein